MCIHRTIGGIQLDSDLHISWPVAKIRPGGLYAMTGRVERAIHSDLVEVEYISIKCSKFERVNLSSCARVMRAWIRIRHHL